MASDPKPQTVYYFFDTSTLRSITVSDGVTFGRKDGNFTFPEDAKISGVHWEFKVTDEGAYVRDLGSSNGTRVNDQDLDQQDRFKIHSGDIIYFGEQKLIFTGKTKDLPPGVSTTPIEKSISLSLVIEKTEPTLRWEGPGPSKVAEEKVELSLGSSPLRLIQAREEEARRRRQVAASGGPAASGAPARSSNGEMWDALTRGEWSISVLVLGLVIPGAVYLHWSSAVIYRTDLLISPLGLLLRFAGIFVALPILVVMGHLFIIMRARTIVVFRIILAIAEVVVYLFLSGHLKHWSKLHDHLTQNQIWFACMVEGQEISCRNQLRPEYNQQMFKAIPAEQRMLIENRFPSIPFPPAN